MRTCVALPTHAASSCQSRSVTHQYRVTSLVSKCIMLRLSFLPCRIGLVPQCSRTTAKRTSAPCPCCQAINLHVCRYHRRLSSSEHQWCLRLYHRPVSSTKPIFSLNERHIFPYAVVVCECDSVAMIKNASAMFRSDMKQQNGYLPQQAGS